MVNLLIVGRYLHYTILPSHLIIIALLSPLCREETCIWVQGAALYRCTGVQCTVQGTGVHYGHNTIQLCHGLSWLLHLLTSVSSETYICWSLALSNREKGEDIVCRINMTLNRFLKHT